MKRFPYFVFTLSPLSPFGPNGPSCPLSPYERGEANISADHKPYLHFFYGDLFNWKSEVERSASQCGIWGHPAAPEGVPGGYPSKLGTVNLTRVCFYQKWFLLRNKIRVTSRGCLLVHAYIDITPFTANRNMGQSCCKMPWEVTPTGTPLSPLAPAAPGCPGEPDSPCIKKNHTCDMMNYVSLSHTVSQTKTAVNSLSPLEVLLVREAHRHPGEEASGH